MTGASQSSALRLFRPAESVKLLTVLSILALIGVALALAAYRYPPPSLALTLAGGIGLTALLAVAIARYEFAVGLAFLLLGVQAIEPAPADAIFAILMAVAAVGGRFDLARVPMTIVGSLGALIVLGVMSTIEALDPNQAAFFFSITLYLAVFAIWLADFVNSEGRARLVVITYLTGAVISALLGVLGLMFMPGNELLVFYETRARALFKDQNVFGPFMIPMILILFEEILNPRLLRMRKPIKMAMLLVLAAAVLLSFSRAAWMSTVLGAVITFLVIAMRRGGLSRVGTLVLVVGATAIVGSLAISASGSEDFLQQRTGLQTYDSERFAGQEAGLSLAEEHPLGIGPGQFEGEVGIAAHSTFIRVLAEQGPLGLAALVTAFLSTLILALRNVVLGRDTYGIGTAALLGAWCGLLANSVFIDTLHWRHLWVVAALIWAGAMRGTPHRTLATGVPPAAPAPRGPPRTSRAAR